MERVTIDNLLQTPRLFGIQVSPDCKWVAWSWANVGENVDVYISPLDKDEAPKKITSFRHKTRAVSWSVDGKSLLVIHDRDGDERYCLYKITIDSREIKLLNEEHSQYFLRGGSLTSDNKYLVFAANYDFEANQEIEPYIIYRQNLETQEKIILAKQIKPCGILPKLNKQGTYILYQRSELHPEGEQVWLVDIDGKNDAEILNFGDDVKVSAAWHPAGEKIVFTVEMVTHKKVGLYTILDKSIQWISDDPSRTVEEVYFPKGAELLALLEVKEAQYEVSLLDMTSGIETPFHGLRNTIPLGYIGNDSWVSNYFNSVQPTDLIVHSGQTILRQVTNVFGAVKFTQSDLVKAESYHWKSVDGLTIQGWLYRSKFKPIGTIVMVHGGPTGHSEDAFDAEIQYFVAQGFNVLDPNYRGSTGFNLQFQNSIKEDGWGGREQDDILFGIKSLIADGIAEEGRLGIMGTSYGGYSSWFAITHFPRKYVAAAIPICGMTDLVIDYNTTRPDLRGYSEEMMGGTPTEVPDKYFNASPVNFIQNIEGSLLIVQGAKDPNVTLENVHTVENILKQKKIAYETLIFEDEGHGISKPKNIKELLIRSAEFLNKSFNQ